MEESRHLRLGHVKRETLKSDQPTGTDCLEIWQHQPSRKMCELSAVHLTVFQDRDYGWEILHGATTVFAELDKVVSVGKRFFSS